jgi:hypothetical protein
MSKRRYSDSVDEVESFEAVEEVTSEVVTSVEEVSKPVNDALVLKVDHTHAGVKYQAGTPVSKLNPSAVALDLMKKAGVI